ncbi:MAG: type VI secretion system tip protein TssI/VgrG [Polyangiaceae bacterium]
MDDTGPARGRSAGVFELITQSHRDHALKVLAFSGRESVSRPFRVDVDVYTDETDPLPEILGDRAALILRTTEDTARALSGVVVSVRRSGRPANGRGHSYRIRLAPRFSCLKLRKNSRVFQDSTVPEIVKTVAEEAGIGVDLKLERSYSRRPYCVQYRETDRGFIERLLAEEGIFYWFHHASAAEVEASGPEDRLVLVDQASASANTDDLTLRLLRGGITSRNAEVDVLAFSRTSAVGSNRVVLRDYDFQRPLLRIEADTGAIDAQPNWSVYRHRGDFEEVDVDSERAAIGLEQEQRGSTSARGVSHCRALGAGVLFTLEVENDADLAGRYLITGIQYKGRTPEARSDEGTVFENRFTCVPAEVAARPRRPRHTIDNVLATAVVVGPENEEIHVDELGRVKVQFHWDDRRRPDGNSSCWVRVMQSWAGSAWGTQVIPRVGMEVLVSFLGGDQDCPVVIGCVPNATHPPPFALPASKTRSGLRTNSYPGGKGFNELSFEDARGQEQVYLHAQRDLDDLVERNRTSVVRGSESSRVEGSRSSETGGTRLDVVGGKAERTVGGDEAVAVAGNRLDAVNGCVDARVSEDLTTKVGRRERREVAGRSDLSVGSDYTVRTLGCYTNVIGKHDKKRSYVVRVEGTAQLSSSEVFEVESEKALVLRSGKSFIRISDDRIDIVSPAVSVRGEGSGMSVEDGKLKLRSKSETLVTSEKILFKTPDTSLGMKRDVEIAGKKILLNSPDAAVDPVKDESKPPTKVKLADASGKALAYQRFLITLEDGSEYSGILDKDGCIEMEFEGKGVISFPDSSNAAR